MAVLLGITSAAGADVDSTPKALRGILYGPDGTPVSAASGDAIAATKAGMLLAGNWQATAAALRASRGGALGVNLGQTVFDEQSEGTVLNTRRWASASTNFTQTQTALGVNFNNTAITTLSSASQLVSRKQIPKRLGVPLDVSFRHRLSLVANSTVDFGLGVPSGVTVVVNDSITWRVTGTMQATPYIISGSNEQPGSAVDISAFGSAYLDWGIFVEDNSVVFTIKNSTTGALVNRQTVLLPNGQPRLAAITHYPVFARLYNAASAPASAPTYILTACSVSQLDDAAQLSPGARAAGLGFCQEVNPVTSVAAPTFSNNAAPGSFTLSNTTAGSALLGGAYQFAAPAGAETDFVLFGFAVPAPLTFYCTGVTILAFNAGAAVATTPTLLQWSLGMNAAAASLTDAASVSRVPLGLQSFPVAAAIGFAAPDINQPFTEAPQPTFQGRFIQVIVKVPIGTNTASQLIRGLISIKGYYE